MQRLSVCRRRPPSWRLSFRVFRVFRVFRGSDSGSGIFRLRRDRLPFALERGHERMPRQDGTLDARREFIHAGKDRQLAHIALHLAAGDHLVHLLEHCLQFGLGLALGMLGQQGGRRFGNAAPGAQKADVFDPVAFHREEKLELVAAQRVVALGGAGRTRQVVEIARVLAVVQDDLLI